MSCAENTTHELMTQQELCEFLRIPDIAKEQKPEHIIANLKRMHGLPCLHIARQPLYPRQAVLQWLQDKAAKEAK